MPLSRRAAIAAALVIAALLLIAAWTLRRRPSFGAPDILVRVQQLNQLATVRYTIQKVVGLRDQAYPVGSDSILLIVQAHVDAGVDLAGMHPDDVAVRSDAVVVRLPEPKILNLAIDEKDTKVWDRQKTWWTPWVPYSLDLEQRARLEGLASARQTALDMGILNQAERNAETSIHGLLGLAGIKVVRFVPWKGT